jgi:hypothetical protein
MANRTAWLSKRVKIGGEWFVRQPVIKASGFVTEKVLHNNQTVHASGIFVLEWYESGKRRRESLGSNSAMASEALREKLAMLDAQANGLTVVDEKANKNRLTVEEAAETFLDAS